MKRVRHDGGEIRPMIIESESERRHSWTRNEGKNDGMLGNRNVGGLTWRFFFI